MSSSNKKRFGDEDEEDDDDFDGDDDDDDDDDDGDYDEEESDDDGDGLWVISSSDEEKDEEIETKPHQILIEGEATVASIYSPSLEAASDHDSNSDSENDEPEGKYDSPSCSSQEETTLKTSQSFISVGKVQPSTTSNATSSFTLGSARSRSPPPTDEEMNLSRVRARAGTVAPTQIGMELINKYSSKEYHERARLATSSAIEGSLSGSQSLENLALSSRLSLAAEPAFHTPIVSTPFFKRSEDAPSLPKGKRKMVIGKRPASSMAVPKEQESESQTEKEEKEEKEEKDEKDESEGEKGTRQQDEIEEKKEEKLNESEVTRTEEEANEEQESDQIDENQIELQKKFEELNEKESVEDQQKREEKERKSLKAARNHVLQEFVMTENKYVRDLRLCLKKFVAPITEKSLLGEREIYAVFCNMSQLADANELVLHDLEREVVMTETEDICIGRIFESHLENLMPLYAIFCVNQSRTMRLLELHKEQNSPFAQFVEEMISDQELSGLPLLSYVIKPVQRLCKYPLLLRELIKATPPSHPDHFPILSAFQRTQELVDEVNELQRLSDTTRQLLEIEKQLNGALDTQLLKPDRHLIKTGRVESGQQVWLFDDAILFAVRQRSILGNAFGDAFLGDTKYDVEVFFSLKGKNMNLSQCEDGKVNTELAIDGQILYSFVIGENSVEWPKAIRSSIDRANGSKCTCSTCAGVANPPPNRNYGTEEEGAKICLKYVDPEERILGWNSLTMRTLVLESGGFTLRSDESQKRYLYLFTDALVITERVSANFFAFKKLIILKNLRVLETEEKNGLPLVYVRKNGRYLSSTFNCNREVAALWIEVLKEDLKVKTIAESEISSRKKRGIKERLSSSSQQQRQIRGLRKDLRQSHDGSEFSSVSASTPNLTTTPPTSPFGSLRSKNKKKIELGSVFSKTKEGSGKEEKEEGRAFPGIRMGAPASPSESVPDMKLTRKTFEKRSSQLKMKLQKQRSKDNRLGPTKCKCCNEVVTEDHFVCLDCKKTTCGLCLLKKKCHLCQGRDPCPRQALASLSPTVGSPIGTHLAPSSPNPLPLSNSPVAASGVTFSPSQGPAVSPLRKTSFSLSGQSPSTSPEPSREIECPRKVYSETPNSPSSTSTEKSPSTEKTPPQEFSMEKSPSPLSLAASPPASNVGSVSPLNPSVPKSPRTKHSPKAVPSKPLPPPPSKALPAPPSKPLPAPPSKPLPSLPPNSSSPSSSSLISPRNTSTDSSSPLSRSFESGPRITRIFDKDRDDGVANDSKSVLKSGFLTKQGGNFKSWKKRWCELEKDVLLYYRGNCATSSSLCGKIELEGAVVQEHTSTPRKFTFEIQTSARLYFLTAESEEETKEWIQAINDSKK